MKYGIKYVFVRSPVIPSIVSSNGKICIFVKLGTYPAALICTTSPNLILKFFLITLFIRIFPSSSLLSTKATHKVYFLFLPLIKFKTSLSQKSYILSFSYTFDLQKLNGKSIICNIPSQSPTAFKIY